MWDLIVSVIDHCLSFYFHFRHSTQSLFNMLCIRNENNRKNPKISDSRKLCSIALNEQEFGSTSVTFSNQASDVCKAYYYVRNCNIMFAGRTCIKI